EECDQRTFAVYKGRIESIDVQPTLSRQPALACNVYMRFLDLRTLCQQMKTTDADFITLSSVLDIRSYREKTSYRAFEVKDFCAPDLTYKGLSEVKWSSNPEK